MFDNYPWFYERYRIKTRHLDPYQDGCYRRLIDEYMSTRQPLPDNDAALARICGISFQDWELHACALLKQFFLHADGMLVHETCNEILNWQDNKTRFISQRAKKAADTRWRKNNKINANALLPACIEHVESTTAPAQQQGEKHVTMNINDLHANALLGVCKREREREDIILNSNSNLDTVSTNAANLPHKPKRKKPPAEKLELLGDGHDDAIPDRAVVPVGTAWELPQAWGEDAERLGWDADGILREAEKFRQYWTSGKGSGKHRTVRGWRQCFANWLERAASRR